MTENSQGRLIEKPGMNLWEPGDEAPGRVQSLMKYVLDSVHRFTIDLYFEGPIKPISEPVHDSWLLLPGAEELAILPSVQILSASITAEDTAFPRDEFIVRCELFHRVLHCIVGVGAYGVEDIPKKGSMGERRDYVREIAAKRAIVNAVKKWGILSGEFTQGRGG